LGLSFQFFEYLSFEYEFQYLANLLQIPKKIIENKKINKKTLTQKTQTFEYFWVHMSDLNK